MKHKGPYQILWLGCCAVLGAASFLACGRSAATIPAPLPIPDAAPVPPVDAGPQALPGIKLAAVWDGGTVDLLAPDASVPPGSLLLLETAVALDDFRVRLLDDDDHLIEGQSRLRTRDGITQVEIQPHASLPASRCCRLVLDGQVAPLPSANHRAYLPWQTSLSVQPDLNAPKRGAGTGPTRHHKNHRRHRRG
jgi:hypothetical protein